MKKDYKYITITDENKLGLMLKHKKPAYDIKNRTSGIVLAVIYYYPQWRQYVFRQIIEGAIFNKSCLKDIQDFIENHC